MGMTKYGLLAFILVILLTVSVFGAYIGYTVDGVPQGGDTVADEGGLLVLAEWAFESAGFMINMTTFQVDNMPLFLSAFFLVVNLLTIFLIITTVRGN